VVDAELPGGLHQPDLASRAGGPVRRARGAPTERSAQEGIATKVAALGRQGALEDPVILVEPAGRVDSQVQALVADLP
jgi:hypothetical protein